MKNRGFTLIELLAVVVLLGLVGTIVTVNLSATLKETKEETCDAFVNDIEEAACVYAELAEQPGEKCNRSTGNCSVKLSTLIKEGLIEEGLLEEKKDECTGQDIDKNKTVNVSWVDGEKKCNYEK